MNFVSLDSYPEKNPPAHSKVASPVEHVYKVEEIRILRELLGQLPHEDRDFLIRHYGNGEPLAVLADEYGVSRQAIHKRLRKRLAVLRSSWPE